LQFPVQTEDGTHPFDHCHAHIGLMGGNIPVRETLEPVLVLITLLGAERDPDLVEDTRDQILSGLFLAAPDDRAR
jgi:hypothetical protein